MYTISATDQMSLRHPSGYLNSNTEAYKTRADAAAQARTSTQSGHGGGGR